MVFIGSTLITADSLGCRGMWEVNPRPEYIFNRGEPDSQRSDPDAGMESSPEGQRLFKHGKNSAGTL